VYERVISVAMVILAWRHSWLLPLSVSSLSVDEWSALDLNGLKLIELNRHEYINFFLNFFFLVFCFDSVCFAVYVNIFRLIISVVFSFSVFVYTQEPICAPSLVLYLHFLYFEIGSQTRTATTTTNNFVSKCFSFRVHSNILFSYFSPSPPPPTPPPRVMSFC